MYRSNGQRDGRWNQKGCLSIIREMEKQMTDRETQPSVAERTADSFTDAQRTVEAAVEDVRQTDGMSKGRLDRRIGRPVLAYYDKRPELHP